MFRRIAMAVCSLYMLGVGGFLFPHAVTLDEQLMSGSIVLCGILGLIAVWIDTTL